MSNTCPKCRSVNTDTARFCSNCSTSLGAPRDHEPSLTKTLESPTHITAPGTLIAGHYEILEKLGQGGMGEVYRALDRNLGRQVAIKVLPAEFSSDPERVARFEREAKLLAILNHPNIAGVYGFEEAKGLRFLVLELVEGETLQTRIDRGALPLEEALETCRQVAEGLEAAHDRGVVHRDLKPGNIMITPEGKVKILDFGLAKAYTGETKGIDIANSPTITAQMTKPGIILGTAAYMSPEQARGRSVDKRADIWAFGCILYECLTGERAFRGETVSDALAHILKGEPDWKLLPQDTPIRIRTLLRRCLEKDPRERLHDIADARIEIGAPATFPSEGETTARKYSPIWLAVGMAFVLLVGILIDRVLIGHSKSIPFTPVVTAIIKLEPGHWLEGRRSAEQLERPSRTAIAISRDGAFVVYSAIEENPSPQAKPRLFLRKMDQAEAKPIPGTEGGIYPFLSPDNRWVGFWAQGTLKKISVEGGVPTTLCDASSLLFGADWSRDNRIVFTDGVHVGLSWVSADGGKAETLTKPDPKREESSHRLPCWLPNGKAALFTIMRHSWDPHPRLALLRLDTGEWHILIPDAANAKYVPTGHLLFLRQGTLMAVRFDPARLKVIGQPVALRENVIQIFSSASSFYNTSAGQFSISDNGSLLYAAGAIVPPFHNSLVWVDQRGVEQPVTDLRLPFFAPRLSPDGQRIAYGTSGQEWQIWVLDLKTGTNSTLTREGRALYPVWTPDGKRLLFSWQKSVVENLFWQPYDGSSTMERLTTSEYNQRAGSWAYDGKTLALVEQHGADTGNDIAMLDVISGRIAPLIKSRYDTAFPEFSPDGRWMAYASNESGRYEVYVQDFPSRSKKVQVSSEGGDQPLWARNSKQLFFRWQGRAWVVDVRTDGDFTIDKPRLLFENPQYENDNPIRSYDLSRDGQRFLMVKIEQRKPSPVTEMVFVQNWFEELKRLVPTGKK